MIGAWLLLCANGISIAMGDQAQGWNITPGSLHCRMRRRCVHHRCCCHGAPGFRRDRELGLVERRENVVFLEHDFRLTPPGRPLHAARRSATASAQRHETKGNDR
jgi:hypothetical protein